jgi:hypothetical protein
VTVTQQAGNPQTAAQWAELVLLDGGAPVTQQNVANMLVWMVNEEPSNNWNDRNNPLNASLGTDAQDGTGWYSNLNTSAYYTAQMIFGQSNMSAIADALSSGTATKAQFGAAVISAPWASSHYGYDLGRFTGSGTPGGSVAALEAAASNATGTPIAGACDDARYLINAASFHFINECQVKAILGGTWMALGGLGMLIAGILFVASGFGKKGALDTAGGIAKVATPEGWAMGATSKATSKGSRTARATTGRASPRQAEQAGNEAFEAGRQRGVYESRQAAQGARTAAHPPAGHRTRSGGAGRPRSEPGAAPARRGANADRGARARSIPQRPGYDSEPF